MAGRGVVDEGMRAYYEQRAAEYDDWCGPAAVRRRRGRPRVHRELLRPLLGSERAPFLAEARR
jgi:hypothetical protein